MGHNQMAANGQQCLNCLSHPREQPPIGEFPAPGWYAAGSQQTRPRNRGRNAMNAQRWAMIESLYHAALAKEPGERSSYLAAACADDPTLRSEIESLLGYPDTQLMSRAEFSKMATLRMAPPDARDLLDKIAGI